ncbi:MAG: hypothetical protein IIZ75_09840 [Lachnospiraceae bacterium]|nr:hypothetical protein [Lachnospiraceae bacterium]
MEKADVAKVPLWDDEKVGMRKLSGRDRRQTGEQDAMKIDMVWKGSGR